MIGILRLDGSGVIDAEEYLAAGQLRPLRDQGLGQGLRLGAGLAPDNSVSGANDARQVDHRTMLTAGLRAEKKTYPRMHELFHLGRAAGDRAGGRIDLPALRRRVLAQEGRRRGLSSRFSQGAR